VGSAGDACRLFLPQAFDGTVAVPGEVREQCVDRAVVRSACGAGGGCSAVRARESSTLLPELARLFVRLR
jgi:hypothetical protein